MSATCRYLKNKQEELMSFEQCRYCSFDATNDIKDSKKAVTKKP